MPGKRYNRQFKLSVVGLVLEGEIPVKGLSDQLNVPCCTLRRWAAEYEADSEDAFPGSGNPVANKDYEILKLKKACEALGVGRGGHYAFLNRPKSSMQIAREALMPCR